MIELGQFNEMKVNRETEHGVYLIKDGNLEEEVLLPGKAKTEDLNVGDELTVFVYTDSEDRIIATRETPKAVVGDFVALDVVDVNDYGAFLDWGLMKDLFVPFKHQPYRLQVGRKAVVHLVFDELSDRIIASAKLHPFFDDPVDSLQLGQEVDVLLFNQTDKAFDCVVNNRYKATLFKEGLCGKYHVGDSLKAFVAKVDDNRITLSERPVGFKATLDEKDQFFEALQAAGGFLPFNSATPADVIKRDLGMSKKLFKKVIGMLYKERRILIEDAGIRVVKK